MSPMLTVSADEAVPPFARNCNETGRLSSVIEASRVSHNREM